ncbi:hypothetical protein BHM03_00048133 [Ensete ventricosum]|nr:hypothetical protein BHM03_00048133 [Ensete ventricosum]
MRILILAHGSCSSSSFMVDGTPIRDFKNLESKGIAFPKSQPMRIYSSLWNADDWATRGGLVKTDWSKAPFTASYRNFKADTCVPSSATSECASNSVPTNGGWWNQGLDSMGQQRMKWVEKNYMIYNYCSDLKRFPQGLPPESIGSTRERASGFSFSRSVERSCTKALSGSAIIVFSLTLLLPPTTRSTKMLTLSTLRNTYTLSLHPATWAVIVVTSYTTLLRPSFTTSTKRGDTTPNSMRARPKRLLSMYLMDLIGVSGVPRRFTRATMRGFFDPMME